MRLRSRREGTFGEGSPVHSFKVSMLTHPQSHDVEFIDVCARVAESDSERWQGTSFCLRQAHDIAVCDIRHVGVGCFGRKYRRRNTKRGGKCEAELLKGCGSSGSRRAWRSMCVGDADGFPPGVDE